MPITPIYYVMVGNRKGQKNNLYEKNGNYLKNDASYKA